MKDENIDALLWRLGITQSRNQIVAEYRKSLISKQLQEQRLILLRKRAVEEEDRHQEILKRIRRTFDSSGIVGCKLQDCKFEFKLGYRHSSQPLEVVENSVSRLHPLKNIVSLWRSQQRLDEWKTKKKANDKYFQSERKRKIPDLQIAGRLPHKNLNLMADYTTEVNVELIEATIEGYTEDVIRRHGNLPKYAHLIYENNRGALPILRVTFRS